MITGIPVPFEITPLLGGLIGVVTALLFVTIATLVAMKIRNERRAQRPSDLPLKKSAVPSSEDLYDTDDRNPDVVPINKGINRSKKIIYPFQLRINFSFRGGGIDGMDD